MEREGLQEDDCFCAHEGHGPGQRLLTFRFHVLQKAADLTQRKSASPTKRRQVSRERHQGTGKSFTQKDEEYVNM